MKNRIRDEMLLAQISDVHCDPMLRRKTLRAAIKEINELSPDIVLITGDLTENGYIRVWNCLKRAEEVKSEEDNIPKRKP
jgi:predicted MPP superfamily phosphohydrolase